MEVVRCLPKFYTDYRKNLSTKKHFSEGTERIRKGERCYSIRCKLRGMKKGGVK